MNRLQRILFAFRKTLGYYLVIRKNPEYYAKNYLFEYRGEQFVNWAMTERERLRPFQNIHAGEDCFIIGNGPSLNKMDLTLLNDYYTFGLNKIFLIFERIKLDLNYLVAVNPFVIEQSREEYLKLDIPIFLSSVKDQFNIKKPNIYSLFTGTNWGFYPDPLNGVNEGHTVTYVAMQLAYYMGFNRVFLIGVDHNFVQNGNPNEAQKMDTDDINHFDPNYFKGKNWHLADLKVSEMAFNNAKLVFEQYSKRKIYDATVGGKLTIFDKIGYEEALSIAKKKTIIDL